MSKDKEPYVHITDHAVLRYLERVKGLDVEAVKREMLPLDRKKMVLAGVSEIKFGKFSFKIMNKAVITVVDNSEKR